MRLCGMGMAAADVSTAIAREFTELDLEQLE